MAVSFLADISQTRASQAIKMKRAATVGVNQPLAVTTSAIPSEAPPKGLLIKVLATGVCHTDLHFIQDEVPLGDGKFWRHRDVMGKYHERGIWKFITHWLVGWLVGRID